MADEVQNEEATNDQQSPDLSGVQTSGDLTGEPSAPVEQPTQPQEPSDSDDSDDAADDSDEAVAA